MKPHGRTLLGLAMAAGLVIAGAEVTLGQEGAGPGGQPSTERGQPAAAVVQVGAGTTSGTTTGSSGPQDQGGGGEPPLPDESLCADFMGEVQAACLWVSLRGQPAPDPAPQNGG